MDKARTTPIMTSAAVSRLVTAWLATIPSEHTRARYRRDLGRLAGWLLGHRGRGLLSTRAEDVIAYSHTLTGNRHDLDLHAHPLRRHNTIATKATAWSSFFTYCVRAGLIEANPVQQARALDPASAYPPHPRSPARSADAEALRALVTEAHRDPWLGGSLGAAMVGLLVVTQWRPERVTTRTLADLSRRGVHDGEMWLPLPAPVLDYLAAWRAERPDVVGAHVFYERSGLRRISAIDLMRLVLRSAERGGLGEGLTATQVARAAAEITRRGEAVELPPLEELRRTAPAPEQLALPDDPREHDPEQPALLPLPEG
ncbi:site-specific integrase [Allokutzneria sp. NRRL B-24872]|uniref:tyrosine-type recombinase/integrase n=1 Tax=Allokutzneria sp. NRRL B-24872 TaxID=1137961 RepID=UPI0011777341|nr:site-specific integrase [Allokutzneria sp. NRRL B-24872]